MLHLVTELSDVALLQLLRLQMQAQSYVDWQWHLTGPWQECPKVFSKQESCKVHYYPEKNRLWLQGRVSGAPVVIIDESTYYHPDYLTLLCEALKEHRYVLFTSWFGYAVESACGYYWQGQAPSWQSTGGEGLYRRMLYATTGLQFREVVPCDFSSHFIDPLAMQFAYGAHHLEPLSEHELVSGQLDIGTIDDERGLVVRHSLHADERVRAPYFQLPDFLFYEQVPFVRPYQQLRQLWGR